MPVEAIDSTPIPAMGGAHRGNFAGRNPGSTAQQRTNPRHDIKFSSFAGPVFPR